jgi:hypothetical protein
VPLPPPPASWPLLRPAALALLRPAAQPLLRPAALALLRPAAQPLLAAAADPMLSPAALALLPSALWSACAAWCSSRLKQRPSFLPSGCTALRLGCSGQWSPRLHHWQCQHWQAAWIETWALLQGTALCCCCWEPCRRPCCLEAPAGPASASACWEDSGILHVRLVQQQQVAKSWGCR